MKAPPCKAVQSPVSQIALSVLRLQKICLIRQSHITLHMSCPVHDQQTNLIRLAELLEFVLGTLVPRILVGMQPPREDVVLPLDGVQGGIRLDAQQLVVVIAVAWAQPRPALAAVLRVPGFPRGPKELIIHDQSQSRLLHPLPLFLQGCMKPMLDQMFKA